MIFKKQKKNRKDAGRTLQDRYPQFKIGRATYGDPKIHSWGERATLCIGAFTSIAPGVQIFLGGEHRTDWVTTFPFNVLWAEGERLSGHPATKGDVWIGNDVWIATEALIMSGVTIGDGAVVGARAVVARDVPPYTIVAGNPAKVVKKRFDDTVIQRLLVVQWWLWDDIKISKMLPLLLNNEIEKFLDSVEKTASV